ncbi:hypothetical protein H310_12397 [Aphanomyces invadans]|uniref:Uncharacterized protein n=1 Tax=Aphanomyces invadans TaxID=157072 RepID=A0A024THR8_9STRA|nr:hypothetical protein H310_12397 [Aphanomyces invadans]ETV93603.1 hypothetical protein H310_12397 [Aphanomyces invadans]|eukprot:XP_008877644.1 hypothetical protein H310_12397 [Aphanomyces invadans]
MNNQPRTRPHLPHLQVALHQQRRHLRMTQILRMLQRGPQSHLWSQMTALEVAALAIKLERLVYRGFPDSVGIMPDDALELRMRRVINLILNATKRTSKGSPPAGSKPPTIVAT